ncbi:MAG: ribosome small subunit-dependent GTPase A [Ruminococcaceae bacterium]|nr:ribosome small subunit-dependent GTPase A [Oscillospiraceae bacterium]
MENNQGLVLKGVGGLYTVAVDGRTVDCRACGRFRRERITPLAGDRVTVEFQEDGSGFLTAILPRRNVLVRPPVANLDVLVIVASAAQPAPNTLVMDKLIAVAEKKEIEPVIVVNKTDLADARALEETYRKSGFPTFFLTATQPDSVRPLQEFLRGKVSAFTGNSGVGKSSLLNCICPELALPTGEISQKLGRGRHTTRTAQLYPLADGGYLVDTAGFSSLDMEQVEPILKDELPFCFREFADHFGKCRFTSCAHLKEVGCAVKAAVEAGEIPLSRYESYVAMMDDAAKLVEWKYNKK